MGRTAEEYLQMMQNYQPQPSSEEDQPYTEAGWEISALHEPSYMTRLKDIFYRSYPYNAARFITTPLYYARRKWLEHGGYLDDKGNINEEKYQAIQKNPDKSILDRLYIRDIKGYLDDQAAEKKIQERATTVENWTKLRPWYDPGAILTRYGTLPLDLTAFSTVQPGASAAGEAAKKLFTVPKVGQRIGSFMERYGTEIPKAMQMLTENTTLFGGGSALIEAVKPDATLESIKDAGISGAKMGAVMTATGAAAEAFNPIKNQMTRWLFPFGAQAETMAVYPALAEGEEFDPAALVAMPLFMGGIEAIRFTPAGIQRMAKTEVGDFMNSGEVFIRPTKELYKPMREKTYDEFAAPFREKGKAEQEIINAYKKYNKKYQQDYKLTNDFIKKTVEEMKKDPDLIALFKNLNPQNNATLMDHLWYRVAKHFADPQDARIIGLRRGVLNWPKPLHRYHKENINTMIDAIGRSGVDKSFVRKQFLDGKTIGPKNFSIQELKDVQTAMITEMTNAGKWHPVVDKADDPYGEIQQFYYYPEGAKKRSIFTLMPPMEAMRLESMSPIGKLWPQRWRSSIYARDGEKIVSDVENVQMMLAKRQDELINLMAEASKKGRFDPDRTIEYSESLDVDGKGNENIEGLNAADIAWGKLARDEVFDYYVGPKGKPNYEMAESLGLVDYKGNLRRLDKYWTAIHEFNKKEIKRQVKLFEELPGDVRAGMTEERYTKDVIKRKDVAKALLTYDYLAQRKIYWEPLLKRVKARIKYLPESRQLGASEYIKDVLGLQKRLYPGWIDWASKALAKRFFSGPIGFSPKTPIVNLTQYITTAIDITPKYAARGAKMWIESPAARERARETGVAEQWRREYFETVKGYKTLQKWVNKVDNTVMAGFSFSERIMRESAYLGSYEEFMDKYKSKVFQKDLKRLRTDVQELIRVKLERGDVNGAADAYAKAIPLKGHYGYGIEHTWPVLKTWQGRSLFQYWSYPLFTGEHWVETLKRGDVKRTMQMLGLQPMIYLAGRPLGVWTGGFVMQGLVPGLAPIASYIVNIASFMKALASGNKEQQARFAREVTKDSAMLLPAGRMLHSRAMKFSQSVYNYMQDPSKGVYTWNNRTGRPEKSTWDKELKKLFDWYPHESAMERKYLRQMSTAEANWSYLRYQGYTDALNAIYYYSIGRNEKADELKASARKKFDESGKPMDVNLLRKLKKAQDNTTLWNRLMFNEPAAIRFIRSLPAEERDDFRLFIENSRE